MTAGEHMRPYSGRVDVLHTHRAVLPRDILNTLKQQARINISLRTTKWARDFQESGEHLSYLVIIFKISG